MTNTSIILISNFFFKQTNKQNKKKTYFLTLHTYIVGVAIWFYNFFKSHKSHYLILSLHPLLIYYLFRHVLKRKVNNSININKANNLNPLNTKQTKTRGVGNPAHGLGQTQNYGGVKPVNEILTLPLLIIVLCVRVFFILLILTEFSIPEWHHTR
jgi:hypothetical protein